MQNSMMSLKKFKILYLWIRKVVRYGLVLLFGLLATLLILRYFSNFIQGPLFWGISIFVNFFVFPMLQTEFKIVDILLRRTTLELLLMNIVLLCITLETSKEYIKSLPKEFSGQLNGTGNKN